MSAEPEIDIILRTGKRRGEGLVGGYRLPKTDALSLRNGETIRLVRRSGTVEYRINDVVKELSVAHNDHEANVSYISLYVVQLK